MDDPGNCVALNVDSAGPAGGYGQIMYRVFNVVTGVLIICPHPPWTSLHLDDRLDHSPLDNCSIGRCNYPH